MIFTNRFILLIISLAVFSCKQSKPALQNENNQIAYFIIGTGGGFTGKYTQYKIYDSGLIEWYNFEDKTYTVYHKVKKTQVKTFFTRIESLKLKDYVFNKPGNLTDYLIVLTNNDKNNRIAWGRGSSEIKPEIIAFFKEADGLTKSLE